MTRIEVNTTAQKQVQTEKKVEKRKKTTKDE